MGRDGWTGVPGASATAVPEPATAAKWGGAAGKAKEEKLHREALQQDEWREMGPQSKMMQTLANMASEYGIISQTLNESRATEEQMRQKHEARPSLTLSAWGGSEGGRGAAGLPATPVPTPALMIVLAVAPYGARRLA